MPDRVCVCVCLSVCAAIIQADKPKAISKGNKNDNRSQFPYCLHEFYIQIRIRIRFGFAFGCGFASISFWHSHAPHIVSFGCTRLIQLGGRHILKVSHKSFVEYYRKCRPSARLDMVPDIHSSGCFFRHFRSDNCPNLDKQLHNADFRLEKWLTTTAK